LAWKKERNERKIRFKGERKFFGLFFIFLGEKKSPWLRLVSLAERLSSKEERTGLYLPRCHDIQPRGNLPNDKGQNVAA